MRQKSILMLGLVVLSVALFAACSSDDSSIPPPCSTCPEVNPSAATARAYVDEHFSEYGLREGIDALDILNIGTDPDSFDRVSFYQTYRGVHVIPTHFYVTIGRTGEVDKVDYEVVTGIDIDTRYQISSVAALTTAKTHFAQIVGDSKLYNAGELAVYRHEGIDYLCWAYLLQAKSTATIGGYFIDAKTGELVDYQILEPLY